MTTDPRTAAERVRDTLLQGDRDGYDAATRALWTAYRHRPPQPVALPRIEGRA